MSIQQRNDVCVVSVDPEVADAVRSQTIVVLEANHHYFEEIREFGPEAQHALSVIYRDAFAVLDAVGWAAGGAATAPVAIPLTAGHVEQLRRCRHDLGHTNIDRLDHPGAAAVIDRDRATAQALDRLFDVYAAACGWPARDPAPRACGR
ncbi:MAG: hypothetical protein JWR63_3461 [Conexibacter sp.]|nr:hypothetical protein [Conexibacter sp.]